MPSNLEWPLELQGLHPVCTWLKCTPESSNARPTMHNAWQSPAATTELTGAGFRFRPLKVDDPESFGCEAAEPIRMHSLETRPLSWDSAASSRWRDLMTRGVRTSEHGSGLHHCRRCWLRRPDLALSQATLHCHCFKNPGR